MRRFDRKAEKPQMPRRIASDVTLERAVPVPMGDGVQLMANVFRSFPPRRSPVLMSVTPYGKDALPDRLGMLLMRLSGVRLKCHGACHSGHAGVSLRIDTTNA